MGGGPPLSPEDSLQGKIMKWISHLIQPILLCFTCSSFSFAADSEPLTQQQQIEYLVNKFTAGKYSKIGADSCLACHREGKKRDASGLFEGANGSLTPPNSPMQAYSVSLVMGRVVYIPKTSRLLALNIVIRC